MSFDFDVIIIGSGFGGSVMSLRLTEKGHKVCLLERGKEYKMHEYPRRMNEVKEKMFWDPKDRKYGFMEFRKYDESDIMSVTASGLGGGSLIYANVMIPMPDEFFKGWPGGINRQTLEPFYQTALDMLEASPYPLNDGGYYQETPKTQYYRDLAANLETTSDMKAKPEFHLPHLAVRFKGDFPGHQTVNKHGAIQSSCNKCGECDIGCNIHAKNTLDLNYIFVAKKKGAEVRTHANVETIVPLENEEGYEVTYKNLETGDVTVIKARKVVVSAGSIGSTALLLKMKKEGHLSNLSDQLGKGWCGNGDLAGTVLYTPKDIEPTKGPVITSAIKYQYEDYKDGFPHGAYVEDAGFPIGWAWYLVGKGPSPKSFVEMIKFGVVFLWNFILEKLGLNHKNTEVNLGDKLGDMLDNDSWLRKSYLLLAMGRDRSDGEIKLRDDGEPTIHWQIDKSKLHYDRVRDAMKDISKKVGGTYMDNPLTKLDKIIAVHPLGGCCMGDSDKTGVVGTNGEAFGHRGLYVVDGSILPTSTGPNPSLTIAAVSEYIAEQFERK